MIEDNLRLVLEKNRDKNVLYLRNLLKEQLQYLVLNYICNSSYGDKFLFKGGTSLRFCFDLPRLSEDLDFDVEDYENFDFNKFTNEIKNYFFSKLKYKDINIKIAGRNRIIYLKFPILNKIKFPIRQDKPSENDLFVRIDLSSIKGKNFKKDITLKSTYDFSFIIKRYSVEDLFSSKIAAILSRETWEGKIKKPRFKGRDYFDIFWLQEKGFVPNFKYLITILPYTSETKIKKALKIKLEDASKKREELRKDLSPFFEDQKFINDFISNFDQFAYKFLKSL